MIIRLQPDQVATLWDTIRGVIVSVYKVPKRIELDLTNKVLEQLMSGLSQCWVSYSVNEEGSKDVHYILITKILDAKLHGVRVLVIDTMYGFKFATNKLIDELVCLVDYAKANGCEVMIAETLNERLGDHLLRHGFNRHKVIYRLFMDDYQGGSNG